MIIDKALQLSSAQAVTAAAASTNYIDLSAAGEIGLSELVAAITCDVTATAAGAATVQFQLQESVDAAFTAPIIVLETDLLPIASLTAGMAPIYLPVPPGSDKRYLRVYYSVGTGPLTAGAFTASIVSDIQKYASYPAANYN